MNLSLEEIISTATPAQRIIWNNILLMTGERAAIQQYFYSGVIGATELITYVARTIYFNYEMLLANDTSDAEAAPQYVNVYDENNVVKMMLSNVSPVWNTTGAAKNFTFNTMKVENIYFSRLAVAAGIEFIQFAGFKIVY